VFVKAVPTAQPLAEVYRREGHTAAAPPANKTRAMMPGVTGETVDDMSIGKIEAIIEALRSERYRWSPVKRIHIPKKNGKTRPLGLPPWSDKLVGEVVRLLLDAYYYGSRHLLAELSVCGG
jgi:retron-type reverse transcriptase